MSKLAIKGGEPLRAKSFPKWPVFDETETQAVADIVAAGRWAHIWCYRSLFDDVQSKLEEFREQFRETFGVDYALSAPSGSVALEIALRNAGVGPGDEVITPPTTWVATNLAPIIVGAEPVFVHVSPNNNCLDPGLIADAITPRTRAIIPVHIGGYTCDMDAIMAVADRRGLVVVEDCAQAHGSRYHGRLVGSIGHFGCFSFELSKLMTAGEGGMVITRDQCLGELVFGTCGEAGAQVERLRTSGRRSTGWNTRLTEMQAALLIAQLGRLEGQRKRRVENAEYLRDRLSQIEGIAPLEQTTEQNYYSYIFRYDSRCFQDVPKPSFMEVLAAEGIPLFSSPSHQPPAYRSGSFYPRDKDYADVQCPVAERAFDEEAIGFQATRMLLGDTQDMDDIADAIVKIRENIGDLADRTL